MIMVLKNTDLNKDRPDHDDSENDADSGYLNG